MFSFEALKARHGDALFVHYGPEDDPEMIMVDGGPSGVFAGALGKRLREMIFYRGIQPLPARLVMVSHIDNDHITGVRDLLKHIKQSNDPLVKVESLWHNSFDDDINTAELSMLADLGSLNAAAAASLGTDEWLVAMAAGVGAGRSLRNAAESMGLVVNAGGDIDGYISEGDSFNMGHGARIRVLSPARGQLEALELKWDDVADRLSQLTQAQRRAALARITEDSLANISSIVVHIQKNGRSMLLTGDARGDHIRSGLQQAGLLPNGQAFVDILKMPHHGSDRNVGTQFFEQIRARHYVFSGDRDPQFGTNPDKATFQMLTAAQGGRTYTIHFTYKKAAIQNWIDEDRNAHSRNYDVQFPESGDHGLWIDLEEPLWF